MSLLITTKKNHITNNIFTWLWKMSTIINLIIFLSLITVISLLSPAAINRFLHITSNTSNWQYYSSKVFLLFWCFLLLIATIVLLFIAWTIPRTIINNNIGITTILAVISINFIAVIFNLYHYFTSMSATNDNMIKIKWKIRLKSACGIRAWKVIDYTLIATFCALTLVCAVIETTLLPNLPYGGGIAIKYIPLMIISYISGFFGGWVTGAISALISLLFSSTFVISPWSYLLDYFLPMTTPAIVAFLRFNLKADKSLFTYINYFLHCFLVCALIYVWQTISGYFIWTQIVGGTWDGFNPLVYALIYNFFHIFCFTYPFMQFVIPVTYRSLVSHYQGYFN